jgi:hypothetical protein
VSADDREVLDAVVVIIQNITLRALAKYPGIGLPHERLMSLQEERFMRTFIERFMVWRRERNGHGGREFTFINWSS